MRYLFIVLAIVVASTATAQNQQYLATDGGLFAYKTNKYGAVLTSVEPFDETQTDDLAVRPGESLYLGRACDAFSPKFGDGVWNRTEGGFFVTFDDLRVAFPGQSIDLLPDDRCRV